MPVEIEKKYRITRVVARSIADELGQIGAEFLGEDFEENIIFGNEMLAAQNAVLRVRKTGEKCLLTYKRRIESASDVKYQMEEETEIRDAATIVKILELLGFEQRVVYEKRRRTWKFRETEVMVDELPFGHFAEIEGSIMAIREAELFLGLDEADAEQKSYPILAIEFGHRTGNFAEARF